MYRPVFATLVAFISSGALAGTPYDLPPKPGGYAVDGVKEIVLKDAPRKKDLEVRLHFPKDIKPGVQLPVIVFSHGLGGSKEAFVELSRFLASHGYVSIHPTHADSIALMKKKPDARRSRKRGAERFAERAGDVKFILDSFAALEEKVPHLKGRLDSGRVGVAGHSFGAYTTQLIAGARVQPAGTKETVSHADARPSAFIAISAQGPDEKLGLHDGSWKEIKRPIMFMTGSKDEGRNGQAPKWRTQPFHRVPPGDKYLCFIEGAYHFSFSGKTFSRGGVFKARLRGEDPSGLPRVPAAEAKTMLGYVQVVTLAFWDAYLKGGDGAEKAKAWLATDPLKQGSKGKVKVSKR